MFKCPLRLLLVACLVTNALWALDDPFVGKWKLNPSKSRFPDTFKVEAAGKDKYVFDFVDGSPETIVVDGTDQPGLSGTTLSVTAQGPDNWKVVRKKGDRTLLTAIWQLSKDGQTLSDTYREEQPGGLSMDYVYKRTMAGAGFAGTWESVSEKMNTPYKLEIEPYQTDGLTFVIPTQKRTRSLRFDGKDYPDAGPGVSPDTVSSGRRESEHSLEITSKNKGKLRGTWRVELSADSKSLTLAMQSADQKKPNVLMFDRE